MEQRIDVKYAPLIRTIQNTIDNSYDVKQFDLMKFIDEMESNFRAMGFRDEQTHGVENILIMRLDVMGDFVLTSGFIRELRANYPFARITLVVSDYVYPLAELCPYVNEVLHFDTSINSTPNWFLEMLAKTTQFAAYHLWERRFSKSICVQGGGNRFASLLLSFISGARERIGFLNDSDLGKTFFNRVIEIPKDIIHQAAVHLSMINALGFQLHSTDMELWYDQSDIVAANRFIKEIPEQNLRIILGIGAGEPSRKYPVEKYADALRTIIADTDATVIIVGGSKESDDAAVAMQILPPNNAINLVSKINLRETAAMVAEADIYIGNDSGVMHMAAAAHIPVIAIYREARDKEDAFIKHGGSEYNMFAPWQTTNISLRPAHSLDECKDAFNYGGCRYSGYSGKAHCITQVKPNEIVEAFDKLRFIAANNPKRRLRHSIVSHNHAVTIRNTEQILNLRS